MSVGPSVCPSVHPSFKWVLCERNSFNFIPILLKLYRRFCQGLKMCMIFAYNPQINFCHFFHSLNLVIFGLSYYRSLWTSGTLWAQLLQSFLGSATTEAYVHQVPCERNSSYNFIPNLLKLYRWFCQGLKMCMTFGYNPQINFCPFFHSLN